MPSHDSSRPLAFITHPTTSPTTTQLQLNFTPLNFNHFLLLAIPSNSSSKMLRRSISNLEYKKERLKELALIKFTYKASLSADKLVSEIPVLGRIKTIRTAGKNIFFCDIMKDGKLFQVVVNRNEPNARWPSQEFFAAFKKALTVGDICGARLSNQRVPRHKG